MSKPEEDDDMDRSSWAGVVRQRREALELTQQQLADAANVSLKTISNIENEALTPQRNTLRKVREALGLSSDLAVAAAQAAERIKIEREVSFPLSPKELDDFLAHLADRVSRLEDRVDQLDGEHLSDPSDSYTLVAFEPSSDEVDSRDQSGGVSNLSAVAKEGNVEKHTEFE